MAKVIDLKDRRRKRAVDRMWGAIESMSRYKLIMPGDTVRCTDDKGRCRIGIVDWIGDMGAGVIFVGPQCKYYKYSQMERVD